MQKNITSILRRGSIKPRDRVKLLVADDVSRERDKKALLTEADRHALGEGWTPKNVNEAKEYNLYNEGRRNIAFSELDAQTTYLKATVGFLRASKYISYILFKSRFTKETKSIKEGIANSAIDTLIEKYGIDTIQDVFEGETIKKHITKEKNALNLVLEYLGLELEQTIYLYAFELADKQLQKDLIALYPEANTERGYLEQQEFIYTLLNSKDELSQTDKEKLAEKIADECFYGGSIEELHFDRYFADIPLKKVLAKWAENNHEESETLEETKEKLNRYAKETRKEKREIITKTILKMINEGLLEEYKPLFKSNSKETCNGKDTQLTHKETFKKWIDVKAKATKTIQEIIDKGELKTEIKVKKHKVFNKLKAKRQKGKNKPTTETKTIITGESLYKFKGDFNFVKDFREQAEDFKLLGALALFLKDCTFTKDYATLLGFLELYKEISKVFDADLTYKVRGYIEDFKKDVEDLEMELIMLEDDIGQANYNFDRVYYLSESYIEDLLETLFNPESVKPNTGELKVYFEAFKELIL